MGHQAEKNLGFSRGSFFVHLGHRKKSGTGRIGISDIAFSNFHKKIIDTLSYRVRHNRIIYRNGRSILIDNISLRIIDNAGGNSNRLIAFLDRDPVQYPAPVRLYIFLPSCNFSIRFYDRILIQVNKLSISIFPQIDPVRCKDRAGNGYKGKQCK